EKRIRSFLLSYRCRGSVTGEQQGVIREAEHFATERRERLTIRGSGGASAHGPGEERVARDADPGSPARDHIPDRAVAVAGQSDHAEMMSTALDSVAGGERERAVHGAGYTSQQWSDPFH